MFSKRVALTAILMASFQPTQAYASTTFSAAAVYSQAAGGLGSRSMDSWAAAKQVSRLLLAHQIVTLSRS
jgi:hypothetical protein